MNAGTDPMSRADRWGLVIAAAAIVAGTARAFSLWLRDRPEWSYFREYVEQPLAQATGQDEAVFGYLPGCKAVLMPFVATEPIGYVLFALVNAASAAGCLWLIHRHFGPANGRRPLALLWLTICAAVPVWFALQNNQLMAPSLFLTLAAFAFMKRGAGVSAGSLFAAAALVKTLPLAAMMFPLVRLRWTVLVTTGLVLAALSIGLASLTDGPGESLAMHLRWPAQVSAQNPMEVLSGADAPRSFTVNQSPSAEVVRLAMERGWTALVWAYWIMVFGSMLVLVWLSIRRRAADDPYWSRVAGWLAWVVFAAPFGRYYYLLFLVPAFYRLGLRVLQGSRPGLRLGLLALPALALLGARGNNPTYAITAVLTLLVHLAVEVVDQRRRSAAARF